MKRGFKSLEQDTTHYILSISFNNSKKKIEVLENTKLFNIRKHYVEILTFCEKDIDFDTWIGIEDHTNENILDQKDDD